MVILSVAFKFTASQPSYAGGMSSCPGFPSDHSQLSSHLLEGSQDLIQLFLRVGRHVTCPEEFSSLGDCRANDRIDKDPIFEEELAHLVSFHGVFNKDGNDRSFARSCIIPERFISSQHLVRISPKPGS